MTTFDDAARKAAEDYFSKLADGDIDLTLEEEFVDSVSRHYASVSRHYADLAETFGLLVELAKSYRRWLQIKVMFDEGEVEPSQIHKLSTEMGQCWINLARLYANPRIAALLAEKKG